MTDLRTRPSTKKNPYTDLDQRQSGSTPYQFGTNSEYDRDYSETRVVEGRHHRVAKNDRGEEVFHLMLLSFLNKEYTVLAYKHISLIVDFKTIKVSQFLITI